MDINLKRNFDRLIVIAIVLLLSFTSLTMSAFNMPLQRMQSDRIRRLQLGLKVEPRVYQAARGPYGVKVKDYRDIVYYGIVYLGSQSVPMRVVLDTGSADFWVPDVSCQECNYYCHGLPQKFAEILCESGCTTIHN
ncbi:unnamed protein product, partial [Anisakis simplex]|uniref:Peptidase A1 domain-containing protein n=1 Tax=Anisakis simplex TaxID=6269 RepID=A0A0M3JEI3_ANISI